MLKSGLYAAAISALLLTLPAFAQEMQAPRVILSKEAPVGEFVWRTIAGSRGYDLLA